MHGKIAETILHILPRSKKFSGKLIFPYHEWSFEILEIILPCFSVPDNLFIPVTSCRSGILVFEALSKHLSDCWTLMLAATSLYAAFKRARFVVCPLTYEE